MNKEYTENDGKYRQLSVEERRQIEAYLMLNCSISKIADLINRLKSTSCEKIKRGKYNGMYTACIAQNREEKRRRESREHSKRAFAWSSKSIDPNGENGSYTEGKKRCATNPLSATF